MVLRARYIDDVILHLWDGSEVELRGFMIQLNSNNREIVLNFEASKEDITFLDLRILIRGRICYINFL